MPNLTLTYFDGPGRAEPVRVALRLGGVPFVDHRLAFPQFAEAKAAGAFPLGSVPVLEVDGAAWTGAGVVTEDRRSIEYVVDGLREGSKHTLRCRCAAEDAAVDATLPWSEGVSARTDVDMVRNHSAMNFNFRVI